MHWIYFAILLYVTAVLQTTLVPVVAIHDVRPDLMVLVAVFYALNAKTYDGLLMCWIVGLVIDLTSLGYENQANVGLHAFSLGLIGWGIVRLRSLMLRDSVATQVMVTFLATALLAMAASAFMMYAAQAWELFGEVLANALFTALYSAALAPYLHWLLKKLRIPLGVGIGQVFKTL